jgi:DNA-binding transcriptional regulator YiaG
MPETEYLTTAQRLLVQARAKKTLREVLKAARKEHRTLQATATALGISTATLRSWLRQCGLPTRGEASTQRAAS